MGVFFKTEFASMFFLVFPRHLDELVVSLLAIELFVKSPCLHPVFGPAFTPYPLFQW
jgi:hypothetical protein